MLTSCCCRYKPLADSAQFVAYYRVSTERQGESGLGLAAQREAVSRILGSGRGSTALLAEYTQVESGKPHTDRPELVVLGANAGLRRCRIDIKR